MKNEKVIVKWQWNSGFIMWEECQYLGEEETYIEVISPRFGKSLVYYTDVEFIERNEK